MFRNRTHERFTKFFEESAGNWIHQFGVGHGLLK